MIVNKFHTIVIISILLPYIGLSIFPSDIQPIPVLFSLIMIVLYIIKNKTISIPIYSYPFIILLFISLFLYIINILPGQDIISMTRSMFSYSTPVVVFLYIWLYRKSLTSIYTKACDVVIIITILGFIINILGFTQIIQIFVNRSIFVEDSVRGLTSFYPEQSRISEQMTIILMIYLIANKINKYRLITLLIISLLSFAGQFFVQLAVIIISYIAIKIINAIKKQKIGKVFLMLIVSALLFVINVDSIENYFQREGLPTRGIRAVNNLVTQGTNSLSNDAGIIIKSSGFLYTLATLWEKPFNFSFSTDLDSEDMRMVRDRTFIFQQYIFNNDKPYISSRINSALGTYIVDYGIFGLLFVGVILFYLIVGKNNNDMIKLTIIVLIFMLFVKIPLTNPSLWLLYSIIILNKNR